MEKQTVKSILFCAFFALMFVTNSCVQEEGFGGSATISGVVVEQIYLKDQSNLLFESAAKDEDVFLVFGEDLINGDDVSTNYDGKFEFKYLWPGKYTVYCYSDTTLNGDEVEVLQEVEVVRGEVLSLDTIYIKKIVDVDDGNSSIAGVVIERTYNEDKSILLSTGIVKDEDVFLQSSTYVDLFNDVKTTNLGKYRFENLWPGDYQVYCYSDTALNAGKSEVYAELTLDANEIASADTIFVDKVVDWDEGFATIKGSITLTNYSGSTIKDISAAQEQEVYLTYNNHDFYDERIRTGFDGSFKFQNLILGDYMIYVYSDDVATGGTEKEVVSFKVTVSGTNQVIDLGEFNINKN